ncbi:hypothetical protein GCM10011361_02800 [Muriicola marianensis]|uniref:Uncharacterized protein n=2 Tax=Muriicola marianensis TaxID=1324801 RepID=A0ABQ1QQG8_9FLAO|nr:hypothetical protein GCM10011361_02800 [Muriicola marianensis]
MLVFCSLTYSQSKDVVVITLIVDLSQLGDDPNDPKGLSFFELEPGSSTVISNMEAKDYTVTVNNGTKIIWQGITTTGENVRILKIQYLSGVNAFESEKIRRGLFGKRVRKTTKNRTGEGYYVYEIKFRPKKMQRYYLDPKIKVN